MLKNVPPLLSPDLLKNLREMGHGDEIAIVDGNYPAHTDARRLVRLDGVDAVSIVEAILTLMPLDEDVPEAAFRPCAFGDCARIEPIYAEFSGAIARHQPGITLTPLPGQAFYDRVRGCFAIVASSEARLYGNIILRKGVIRSDSRD